MAESLETELVTDPDRLAAIAPAWDALAVESRRPLASPAWMLGGWRHLGPAGAEPRTVAVWDGGELIALAPFCAERKRAGRIDLRPLGGPVPRTGPLARRGRAWEAAGPIASALAASRPRPDVVALECAPVASHWPAALVDGWPGAMRPPARRYFVQPSPTVSLAAGSFDAWLAGKSANFRGQMRRLRRQFAEAGGVVRASTHATLRADVEAFMRLHAARWEGRGTSAIVTRRSELSALYEEVGAAHVEDGRLRLLLLELDGEPISAQLFAAAGGEVIHLNGGWDERHARLKPSLLCIVAGIEDAFTRGDLRMDLGPGAQSYKARLADGNDPVAWTMLVVPRARMGMTLARVAPALARVGARDALKRALPPERQQQLRALRGGRLPPRRRGEEAAR